MCEENSKLGLSLEIRIGQILRSNSDTSKGYFHITHSDLKFKFEKFSNPLQKPDFVRVFSQTELETIRSGIEMILTLEKELIPENQVLFLQKFRTKYDLALSYQSKIKDLSKYGVLNFYYPPLSIDDLTEDNQFYKRVDIVLNQTKNLFLKYYQAKKIPFDLPFVTNFQTIYFGSISMICNESEQYIVDFLSRLFYLPKLRIKYDDYKSLIENFSYVNSMLIGREFFHKFFEEENQQAASQSLANNLEGEQRECYISLEQNVRHALRAYNIHCVKVPQNQNVFHVIYPLVIMFEANKFYQVLYCDKNTDIDKFFNDIELNRKKYDDYFIIVHPEYLSINSKMIFIDRINERICAIPNMNLNKIIVLTAQSDAESVFMNESNYITSLSDYQISCFRNITAKNIPNSSANFYLAKPNATNYSQYIFIDSSTSQLPNMDIEECHLKLSINMFDDAIHFWDHLFSYFYFGYCLYSDRAPILNKYINKEIYFEIPDTQIIDSLNDFPFPILDDNIYLDKEIGTKIFTSEEENSKFEISINLLRGLDIFKESIYFPNENNITIYELIDYFYPLFFCKELEGKNSDIPSLVLSRIEQYTREFIEIYQVFKNENQDENIIYFLLVLRSAITLYYHDEIKTSKTFGIMLFMNMFVDSEPPKSIFITNVRESIFHFPQNRFTKRLIDILNPINERMKSDMILNYDQFFSIKYVDNNIQNDQIKIFTMIAQLCSTGQAYISQIQFLKIFNLLHQNEVEEEIKNLLKFHFNKFKIIEQWEKDEKMKIIASFFKTNDISEKSYQSIINNVRKLIGIAESEIIRNTSISITSFIRLVKLFSCIKLGQNTILIGDSGCGKTSLYKLIVAFLNILRNIDIENHMSPIMIHQVFRCHGGITCNDIDNYLSKSVLDTKNLLMIDELNTTPVYAYIEEKFLNSNSKDRVIIGAVNQFKETDRVSRILSKIGMAQYICFEEDHTRLNQKIPSYHDKDLSNFKYFVHPLSKESQPILIKCNPKKFLENDSKLWKEEESLNTYHLMLSLIDNSPELYEVSKIEGKKEFFVYSIEQIKLIREVFPNLIIYSMMWIRKYMNERASISYRDPQRTFKIFLYILKILREDKCPDNSFIHDSMIFSLIICYGLRLPESIKINEDDKNIISEHFNKIIEIFGSFEINNEKMIIRQRFIKYLEIKASTDNIEYRFKKFVAWYNWKIVINNNDIWKFSSFMNHLCVVDIALQTNQSLFIIGMPGTSKSYAIDIINQMKKINVITYFCSRGSSAEGLKANFFDAAYKIFTEKKSQIPVINLIEEMGLANLNPERPQKYIPELLDEGLAINDETNPLRIPIPTIGLSNYQTDFANAGRNLLICTDIPRISELVEAFTLQQNQINSSYCFGDRNCFYSQEFNEQFENLIRLSTHLIENKDNSSNIFIQNFFNILWENKIPDKYALRSIYSYFQIVSTINKLLAENKTGEIINTCVSYLCQIARESISAQSLSYSNELSKITSVTVQKMLGNSNENLNEAIDKFSKYDNVQLIADRKENDKITKKSLAILTQNYEALEYIDELLFRIEKKHIDKPIKDSIVSLKLTTKNKVNDKLKNIRQNSNLLEKPTDKKSMCIFAEDFLQSVSSISTQGLKTLIEQMKDSDNNEVIIIGNHPMLDSILSLLNANTAIDGDDKPRIVSIGSDGFSFSVHFKNFHVILIVETDELANQSNPYPLPLLDRPENLYLNWENIKFYVYLGFISLFQTKFMEQELNLYEFILNLDKEIQEELEEHMKPDSQVENRFDNDSKYLHIDPYNLIQNKEGKKLFKNEILNQIIRNEWKHGIRAIIFTKSKILEKGKSFSNFIEINDNTIGSSSEFDEKIKNTEKGKTIVIKCNEFSALHNQHLKYLIGKSNIENNVFIIYYQCKQSTKLRSTFKWPVFWMEDISEHEQILKEFTSEDIKTLVKNKFEDGVIRKEFDNILKEIIHCIIRQFGMDQKKYVEVIEEFDNLIKYYDNVVDFISTEYFEHFQYNIDSSYSAQSQFLKFTRDQLQVRLYPFISIWISALESRIKYIENIGKIKEIKDYIIKLPYDKIEPFMFDIYHLNDAKCIPLPSVFIPYAKYLSDNRKLCPEEICDMSIPQHIYDILFNNECCNGIAFSPEEKRSFWDLFKKYIFSFLMSDDISFNAIEYFHQDKNVEINSFEILFEPFRRIIGINAIAIINQFFRKYSFELKDHIIKSYWDVYILYFIRHKELFNFKKDYVRLSDDEMNRLFINNGPLSIGIDDGDEVIKIEITEHDSTYEKIIKAVKTSRIMSSSRLVFIPTPVIDQPIIQLVYNYFILNNSSLVIENDFVKWFTQKCGERNYPLIVTQILQFFDICKKNDGDIEINLQFNAIEALLEPWTKDYTLKDTLCRILKDIVNDDSINDDNMCEKIMNKFKMYPHIVNGSIYKVITEKNGNKSFAVKKDDNGINLKLFFTEKSIYPRFITNYITFNSQTPYLSIFIKYSNPLRSYEKFVSLMSMVMELRYITFSQSPACLFILLNCTTLLPENEDTHNLIQFSQFSHTIFQNFSNKINEFSKKDFDNQDLTATYQQINYLFKKFIKIHNQLVNEISKHDNSLSIVEYQFSYFFEEMSLTQINEMFFSIIKSLASDETISLNSFEERIETLFFHRETRDFDFVNLEDALDKAEEVLTKAQRPLVKFIEQNEEIDFLGFTRDDWINCMEKSLDKPKGNEVRTDEKINNIYYIFMFSLFHHYHFDEDKVEQVTASFDKGDTWTVTSARMVFPDTFHPYLAQFLPRTILDYLYITQQT